MPFPDSNIRARFELVDLIESRLNTPGKEEHLAASQRQNFGNTRTGATASVSATLNS